jgi:hypothetical protein
MTLTELEAKAKAATPGPWSEGTEHGVVPRIYVVKNGRSIILEHMNVTAIEPGRDFWHFRPADLTFIAAANPETVQALIRDLRRAREALEHLKYCVARDALRFAAYEEKLPDHLASVVSAALDAMEVKDD